MAKPTKGGSNVQPVDFAGKGSTDKFGFQGEVREHTQKLLNLFRVHLNGSRDLGAASIDLAMGNIDRFMRFVRKPIWEWTHDDVTRFISHKKDTEDYAVSTQATYFTYLRALQNWLFTDLGLRQEIFQKFGVQPQEWIDARNAIPVRNKNRKRKRATHALAPEEFDLLMDEFDAEIEQAFACNSKAAYPLMRDKVMASVMYEYGLRVSEVVAVRVSHWHGDRRYPHMKKYAQLRVYGKGQVTGTPHLLDPKLVALLEMYEEYIRPHFQSADTTDVDLYFYSERGGSLNKEQVRRRLLRVGHQAGIKKRVTPHVMRRSHGTDAMDLLGPVGTQQQLRHADIRTTFGYYHPDPAEAGRSVARAVRIVIKKQTPPKESA